MKANNDETVLPADVADGLGVGVEIDGARPLADLTAAVNAACDRAEEREGRSVVVLRLATALPEHRAWPGAVELRDVSRWEKALRRLERLPTMNIAVARGTCGGPSLDVLLTADYRIVTPDLLLLPPVNDGHFWPGMSVHRLVQHLGVARARQIVLWGDDIEAERAIEVGLVDQVTESVDEALHTAAVLMGRISDAELAVRRQLLYDAASTPFEDALGLHLAACARELRRLDAEGSRELEDNR
ncbi:enoyl-CoA-hydratase DpgB [Streptomyces sp. ME19-01-6]|uniref:enoyl-CoA-hydratase DpgB n=1 Tax=Streptomyces sp. ME19-01-6 TaxID=3028686 RepID=UPI0029B9F9A3|nr:enoyl-CoA-hydratase DpgB [Streptomyces sp. ME19-01-6]MDX3228664.1 enoyl-CoA hydratase/isomerase family protein [Streptomyces sp. ME19-01-6]